MSKMSDEPPSAARVSIQTSQELSALQQALLESVKLFAGDTRRFAHDWLVRSTTPPTTQHLAEINEDILVALEGLEGQFNRPQGPERSQVASLLGALLGAPDAPGPLTRLQALAAGNAAAPSLDDQRLLSEIDTLFIQLNGLRAQWRDYLALAATAERGSAQHQPEPVLSPLPPNQSIHRATGVLPPLRRFRGAEDDDLPPSRPAAPPVSHARVRGRSGGMGDLLRALLPVLLVLVVLAVLVSGIFSRLAPTGAAGHPAPTTQTTPAVAPSPRPSATAPAGPPQLSVSPTPLLLPCPGSGAATLQLVNSGTVPLDWQAAISSASGSAPGILLDGENAENGHLNPGEVTQISVTAQALNAQGTISISYSGESAPVSVPYSVSC